MNGTEASASGEATAGALETRGRSLLAAAACRFPEARHSPNATAKIFISCTYAIHCAAVPGQADRFVNLTAQSCIMRKVTRIWQDPSCGATQCKVRLLRAFSPEYSAVSRWHLKRKAA